MSKALVVVEQGMENAEIAMSGLMGSLMEVVESWVLLLQPNRVTMAVLFGFFVCHLVSKLREAFGGRFRAAADASLAAPDTWSLTAKQKMALSGRNPEANIDRELEEPFDIRTIRRDHPIYAMALDRGWRTWPPIARARTVLDHDAVRSMPRRSDERTWQQITRLTAMLFEIYTRDEVARMTPELRAETEWPHLFWETQDVYYTPGDPLELVVHARGSEDYIYHLRLRAPGPRSELEQENEAARRQVFVSCTCPDFARWGTPCKHGVACAYQLLMIFNRSRQGIIFPPSALPVTGRFWFPEAAARDHWDTWRAQARLRARALEDNARMVADQLIAFGQEVADGEEDSAQELLAHADRAGSAGRAAAEGSSAAPSGAEPGQGGAVLYVEDLGSVNALLDAKSAQAECLRMIRDCSSVSTIDFTAFTIDRADVVDALRDAASLGAQARVLVDRKNTLNGNVRDQLRLLGELALPTTRVQVRVLAGGSLRPEYTAVGRHYATDFTGHMHCKFVRVDTEVLIGSCNWTTASRANHECCVKVTLTTRTPAVDFFDSMWEQAAVLTQADVDAAARSGSASSSSGRR